MFDNIILFFPLIRVSCRLSNSQIVFVLDRLGVYLFWETYIHLFINLISIISLKWQFVHIGFVIFYLCICYLFLVINFILFLQFICFLLIC